MMGKKNGCLKLIKDENPDMIIVHCVIHRENLVAKKTTPVLHEVLDAIVKCINLIKRNAKSERLFKLFCKYKTKNISGFYFTQKYDGFLKEIA
jgi:hypothetical protein